MGTRQPTSPTGGEVRCVCGSVCSPNAKFCWHCGEAMGQRCSQCGTALPRNAKFCSNCGHAMSPPHAQAVDASRPQLPGEEIDEELEGASDEGSDDDEAAIGKREPRK